MAERYDIVIVGGGPVGASLACALGGTGLRLAVVEAVPFASDAQPSYDDRAIALAYGTRRIFEGMGVWAALKEAATPIHSIHVSERGRFGVTRLDCREEGVEALGYVVTGRDLGRVLAARLAETGGVDLRCPARVCDVRVEEEAARVEVETENGVLALETRLVVAADGMESVVRKRMGFASRRWEYGQTAVIANVTPEYSHRNTAYERFTDSGPLAVLPLGAERCAVVWTVRSEHAQDLLALDDAAFLERLQARFGYRLGRFLKAGVRRAYPLALVRVREHVRHRVALVGNAAHTIHPVAGQGFNLGLRDVAALADVVLEARRRRADVGDMEVLSRYAEWRHRDHFRVTAFTDALVRLFSNPLGPLGVIRGAGLTLLEFMPVARHRLARLAMGLAGRLPRLARGLPVEGGDVPGAG